MPHEIGAPNARRGRSVQRLCNVWGGGSDLGEPWREVMIAARTAQVSMDKVKTEERAPISAGGVATAATASPSSHAEPLDVPDLSDPRLYINRELSWLAFNERVL